MPAVSASNTAVPNAPGYGEMVVSQAGLISISGKLGDGTAFGTMAQLHADGKTWTLYTPLYGGLTPGGIAGTMTFENLAGSDCDGSLEWIKHPQTSSGIYSSGFAVGATLDAAKYAAAPSLTPGTTGTIAFANGDLLFGPFADNLSISAAQKITVDAAGTVVLFNPANGAFGGWFPYPGTDAKTYFNGIFYKKPAAEGVGLFLGSSQSGSVEITPP